MLLDLKARMLVDVLLHHLARVDVPSLPHHREYLLPNDGVPVLLFRVLLLHLLQDLGIFGDLSHDDAHSRDSDSELLGYVLHEVLLDKDSMGDIENFSPRYFLPFL